MALNRRQQLQLDRMGDTQYDSLFWGTAAPLTPYMPGEEVNDSGQRLRYPGSGPETFTRNGTEYTRGYGSGYFTGPNAWMLPYMISDPEFGDAIPSSIVPQYQAVSGNSFLDRFAPLLGMGLMGLPLATSMGALGAAGEAAAGGASSFLPNSFDMTLGGLGDAAGIGVGDIVPTSAAFGAGETYLPGVTDLVTSAGETYLPGVLDQVPANLGQMGGGGIPSWMGPASSAASLTANFDPNADYSESLSGNYGTPTAVAPGVSQATGGMWPAIGGAAAGSGAAAALSQLLAKAGIDVTPDQLSLIGSGLGLLGGYASAQQSANRVSDVNNQMLAMAERDRQDRMPFLNQSTSWMQNPSDFWNGSVGQEIARQTARAIGGSRQENLFDNPTGQSLVMQSLAPQWLNAVTQTANLGLRSTAPLNTLADIGLQSAGAQGRPGAVLGAGIADIFGTGGSNPLNTQNDMLRQILTMQGGAWNPNFGGYRLG